MAKKQFKHTDLSDRKCSTKGCNTMLKTRIVQTYPKADKCYACSHPTRKTNKVSNMARREAASK